MYNSSSTQPAFFGHDEGEAIELADGVTAIWYTHGAETETFPSEGIASSFDENKTYNWVHDVDQRELAILADATELASHPYYEDHTLRNWAHFRVSSTYSISIDQSSLNFGTADTGYTQPEAQTVTITNTGNKELTVTLPASENYTISGSGEGWSNGSITLAADATAIFTVQPNTGLGTGTYDETLTVTGTNGGNSAQADVSLIFTVELPYIPPALTYYYIDADAVEGGVVNPSGRVAVVSGGSHTFTITADKGYEITDVLVDGVSVGAVSSYTFSNVRENHTISVTFRDADRVADPDGTGVSDWLITEEHVAYLNGYPGDKFGPNDSMTRGQAAQMFYNLLLDKDVPVTVTFTDVPDSAWYADAVNTLASLGMINGVGDNKFEPERSITRAEFTAIAMRFARMPNAGDNQFSDVSERAWYYEYVAGSTEYGWINGYPDGCFGPNDNINRGQVTAIVNRMLARSADKEYVDSHTEKLVSFSDVARSHWAYYHIAEATNFHSFAVSGGTENWTDVI